MPRLSIATDILKAGDRSVNSSSGSITFSISVRLPRRAPDWNRTPHLLRARARAALSLQMSAPSNRTSPDQGFTRPRRWFMRVLFPQPLRPTITRISPMWTFMDTLSRTFRPS
ncbi:MAG: hypothetical protein AO396_06055 [Candidatus Fermentibacter daniensis]|nr:MAG: hypothetical protein AO396_06055 [Candidatus Fermentibacter daniensis]